MNSNNKNNKKNKRRMVFPCILTGIALLAAPAPFVYIRCAIKYNEPELIESKSKKENTIYNTFWSFSYYFKQNNPKYPKETKVSVTNVRINGSDTPTEFTEPLCTYSVDDEGNIKVSVDTYSIIDQGANSVKFDLVFENTQANTKYTLTDFSLIFIEEPEEQGDSENVWNSSDQDVIAKVTIPEALQEQGANISYSKDKGSTWSELGDQGQTTISPGQTICFKGNNPNGLNTKDNQLTIDLNFDTAQGETTTGGIVLFGSIMSLLDNGGTNTNFDRTTIPNDYCFKNLFKGSKSLFRVVDYEASFFEATNLKPHCYEGIFEGCTNLTLATQNLPATELKDSCYKNMFNGCRSLATPPELPATTLADECYYQMFKDCSSLLVNNLTGDLFLTCPDPEMGTDTVKDMFSGTGGDYKADPVKDGKYYYGQEIEHVTEVKLSEESITIDVDESHKLTATVLPETATYKNVIWTSDDDNIATVDQEGNVTGVSGGTTYVTVTTIDGHHQATCKVIVNEPTIHVESVTLNRNSTSIRTGGETETLVATVLPQEATIKDVTWKSNDETVATVSDDGIVTPVGIGTTTITCTSVDSPTKSGTCNVTIFTPDTFKNTEWAIIADVAETFESSKQDETSMRDLCLDFTDTPYISEISPEITDPNRQIEAHLDNFIGKEHYLKINSLDHLINIIGINHDLLQDETNKYAAFTFETRNVLCYKNADGDIAPLGTEWQDDDFVTTQIANNGSYPTSWLNYDLNGNAEGKSRYWMDCRTFEETLKGVTALDMIFNETTGTSVLKGHLKTVQKQVFTRSGEQWIMPPTTPTTYNAMLFPLTVTEAGYSGTSKYYHAEGIPYAYWQKSTANMIKVWVGDEFIEDNADYYWYSSPAFDTADKTSTVWWYNPDYEMGPEQSTVMARVAFAFCI